MELRCLKGMQWLVGWPSSKVAGRRTDAQRSSIRPTQPARRARSGGCGWFNGRQP